MIVLCCRSPDDSKIKQKMVYSSSKDALRKALVGVQVDIQANDISDIEYESGESVGIYYSRNRSNSTVFAVLEKCERMR